MIDDRYQDHPPDQKLARMVRKFSVLEGRQPRVMVSRSQECDADNKIKEVSVDLAGFGFNVDIGIPFDSISTLGRNAIENDADVLILFGVQGESGADFLSRLTSYFKATGDSDLLMLNLPQDYASASLHHELIRWLETSLA